VIVVLGHREAELAGDALRREAQPPGNAVLREVVDPGVRQPDLEAVDGQRGAGAQSFIDAAACQLV
jgi:hypothetical protein